MKIDDLELSETGKFLMRSVIRKVKNEQKKYGRIRTRFFYPSKSNKRTIEIQLRDFINSIIHDNNLKIPYDNRDTGYFKFVNTRFFDVMSLQLHRLHPDNYLLVTQDQNGRIYFIIRDIETSKKLNIKLNWLDDNFKEFSKEDVPFYLTKAQLIT